MKSKSPEVDNTPSYQKFAAGFAEKPAKKDEIKNIQPQLLMTQPAIPEVKMPASATTPIPEAQEKLIRSFLRTFIAVISVYKENKCWNYEC